MQLTETQYQTLQAAVSRIIPTDDTPGAAESGAIDYITGQFERDLRDQFPIYVAGLEALNTEALASYQSPFAHLLLNQQDSLLTSLEFGTVQTDWPFAPGVFFEMLVNHTAEGFYSDPENGGNRNAISWGIIGF